MTKLYKTILFSFVFALTVSAFANELFVDCKRPDDSGDGKSEATAKQTIQGAIDAAFAGDTITVLPGVYTNGYYVCPAAKSYDGVTYPEYTNRVGICKANLTIRAKSSDPADTHVVGQWDRNFSGGIGPTAIHCFCVTADGYGAVIRGFTIRDGASRCYNADGTETGSSSGADAFVGNKGGGVVSERNGKDATDFYVVDCVVSNCVATRGGGVFGGTVVRSLLADNTAYINGAASRYSAIYNSVIARNRSASALAYIGDLVNCTVCDNGVAFEYTTDYGIPYNCVFADNGTALSATCPASNCVIDVTSSVALGCEKSTDEQFNAPLFGDYRPVAGTAAARVGDVKWLERIPEAYRDTDYLGQSRTTGGAVAAGAVEERVTATCPVTRITRDNVTKQVITVDDKYTVGCFGQSIGRDSYFRDTALGRMHKYAVKTTTGIALGNFAHNGLRRFPKWDDTIYLPSASGASKTVIATESCTAIYAKPGADATIADGSYTKPYATISKAVSAALGVVKARSYNSMAVVCACPGDYTEGGETCFDITNRLYVSADADARLEFIRIRSMEGPEKTAIVGAPDPNNTYKTGIGPGSVRCVGLATLKALVQGFTLRDGYASQVNASDSDGNAARGGAVSGGFSTGNCDLTTYLPCVTDCIISNCWASRGAVGFGCHFDRCYVADNHVLNNGLLRRAVINNSIIVGNACSDGVFGDDRYGFNCTVYGNSGSVGSPNCVDSVACGNTTYDAATGSTVKRCFIYYAQSTLDSTCYNGRKKMNPLVDAAGGDFRVYSGSPAATLGTFDSTYWFRATDYYGKPRTVGSDGSIAVGAVAELAPGAFVVPSNLSSPDISPIGHVADGGTVTALNAASQPLAGFVINGHTQETVNASMAFDESAFAEYADANGGWKVDVAYGDTWYVSTNGSDTACGGSVTGARKTIQSAVDSASDGQRVLVLPGTYDEGGDKSASCTIPFRAYINKAITVESRDGAEKTVIAGKLGSGANGRGSDAVHGAYVGAGALLRGFTIRDGGTAEGTSEGADCSGGGVIAADVGEDTIGRIADCIITNCTAQRGGGARHGSFTRCVFSGNRVDGNGGAVRHANCYECVFIGNGGVGASAYLENNRCYGCTFTADNTSISLGYNASDQQYPSAGFVGCLFGVGAVSVTKDCGFCVSNCVIGSASMLTDASFRDANTMIYGTVSLDARGVPTTGCAGVDRLDCDLYTNLLARCPDYVPPKDDGLDLYGGQRVYNRRRDVGAAEADWRPVYTRRLRGLKPGSVTAASPDAVSADGGVRLYGGELALSVPAVATAVEYGIPVQVTGSGTLTVSRNGETLGTVTAAEGSRTFVFKTASAFDITYAFASDDATSSALLGRLTPRSGLVIFLK